MSTKSAAGGLVDALKLLAVMPAAGAGIGGLIGAARAEKGKRLRTALGDAGVGGMAGLGFALGGLSGGAAGMAMGGKSQSPELQQAANDQNSAALGGLGAGVGAVGAGMLGQKLRQEMEEEYDNNNPMNMISKIGKDATMTKTEKKARILPQTIENLKFTTNTAIPTALPGLTLAGLLGGGMYGGMSGEGVTRGALRGGLIGAGAGTGGLLGMAGGSGGVSDLQTAINGKLPDGPFGATMQREGDRMQRSVMYGALPGAALGTVGGGMAGNQLFNMLDNAMQKNKSPDSKKKKTEKKSSASQFGEKLAAGFDWKSIMNTGLGGAALGAGLGGLAGLIAPGEDGQGRRKSRLSSALSGALGGGLLGGGAAAVGEAVSPGFGQGAYNYANDLYRQLFGRSNPQAKTLPNFQAPTTAVPMAGGKQMRAHPGVKSLGQLQSERQQYLNPGQQMDEISFPGAN